MATSGGKPYQRIFFQAKEEVKQASESKSRSGTSSDVGSTQEASESQPTLDEVLSQK